MHLRYFLPLFGILFTAVPAWTQRDSMPPSYQKLVDAILADDIPGMKQAVSEGASINSKEERGMTPLAYAIESHQIAAFRWLLEQGAKIGLQEQNSKAWDYGSESYPLSLAISVQNRTAFEELLKAGAQPNVEQLSGSRASPAFVGLIHGNVGVLKSLEEAGLDWKQPVAGGTPLQVAIYNNNTEAVSFLLDGRASASAPMSNGNCPLADAAVIGNSEIVKSLLAKGADPNFINQSQPIIPNAQTLPHTALINAVRRNSIGCVELLLKAGADPKALDNAAIKWADLLGNESIYNLLLKSGAEKPVPHAFLDLPQLKEHGEAPRLKENIFSNWDFLATVNASPSASSSVTAKSLTVAVVSLSDKTAEASSLLAAALSNLPTVTLVERDELRALGAEQVLNAVVNPLTAARNGALEGADAVIFLTENSGSIEVRAVNASSGLIIFSTIMAEKNITQRLMERVAASTLQAASNFHGDLSERTLISLPILTASRSTPEVDIFTRQLASALAMYLGNQPGIYVLDRKEMQRLSQEKNLKTDLSTFVQSGLLVDGGIELSPNRPEEVTLTIRARTIDGTERAVVESKGTLKQPSVLLSNIGMALLERLGKSQAVELDRGSEAKAYFEQARAAYDSQLWPQAYALAQAADALGFSDPEFAKFRILTISRLLRSDLQVITEGKYAANKEPEEREILARCMPLDFLPEAITPRSTGDYLDLAEELLDLVSPIVYQPEAPANSNQCLWEYLPTVFAAATLPLELTIPLSDRERYAAGLGSLRAKLLAQSETAIARSKEWRLNCTYRELVRQRCRLLCFWMDDESRVIAEVVKTIEEAHRLEFPYILHFLMEGVTPETKDTPRRIGSRLGTFPERLAATLAASELPHARLKGILRMAEWAIGLSARKFWEEQLPQAYEQVFLFDHTPAGIGSVLRFEENPPTLKNSIPDGPNMQTFIEPWYPEPRYLPKKLRTQLTTLRLEYLAEHGLGSNRFFVDPKELDINTLNQWLRLCEASLAKFESGPDKDLYPEAARYFRDFRIDPLKAALAFRSAIGAPPPTTGVRVTGIVPAELPAFRGMDVQKSGRGLNVIPQYQSKGNIWVSIENGGFLNLSPETKVIEAVPFPKGHFSGSLRDSSGRFLAAELRINNSFGSVFAIYDREKKIWKFFQDAIYPRPVILGNDVLVSMLHHPDPKTNSDFAQDERTTFALERINPVTGERVVLASSRRTPTQSPVDNHRELVNLHRPVPLSETEFAFLDFVYNLDTMEWRPITVHDRKLISAMRPADCALSPWSGRLYSAKFQKETGHLVIKGDISEPTVGANGKPTKRSRHHEIPIPPFEIHLENQTVRAEERRKLVAPESFGYYLAGTGEMLAWNDQVLAVIPQSLYLPRVLRWLEENQVPK